MIPMYYSLRPLSSIYLDPFAALSLLPRRIVRLLAVMLLLASGTSNAHAAANTAPVATDDEVVVHGWGTILLDVLANDYDDDGDPLVVTLFPPPSGVGVSKASAEVVVISVAICLTETTSFDYQVSDSRQGSDIATVTLVPGNCTNSDPNANPDSYEVSRNDVLAARVLDNDVDPEGDGLCITALSGVTRGIATIEPDCQSVEFVPESGYVGSAAGFQYTIQDSAGATASAPVAVMVTDPAGPQGDELEAVRGKILVIDAVTLLANDPSAVTLTGASSDQGDRIDFIQSSSGAPVLLFHAPQLADVFRTFTYTVEDTGGVPSTGSAVVLLRDPIGTMRARDDARQTLVDGCLVVDFDHLVVNDTATGAGIQSFSVVRMPAVGGLNTVHDGDGDLVVSYQVPVGYAGRDFFQYLVEDEFGVDIATVVIDLKPAGTVSLDPVAGDDYAVTETQSVTIPVLRNDYSPDCSPVNLLSVTSPLKGTAGISGSVNIFYNPYPQAIGTDTFHYVIDNVHGDTTGAVAVKLADTVPPPRPVINYDIYGCQSLATCTVNAEESRHGDGSHYSTFYSADGVTPNCVTGWYLEGSLLTPLNQPVPNPLGCYVDFFDHHPVQSLAGHYSEPGLYLANLVLLDLEHREEAQRWVPVGATTRPQVSVTCNRERCSFRPVGSFPNGVITRFNWLFDGPADPDPVVQTTADPVEHVFNGAQVGDEFDIWLQVERFDGSIFNRHHRVTIQERLPVAPENVTVISDTVCFATGPVVVWTAPLDPLLEGFRIWRQVEGQIATTPHLVAEIGPVETRIFDSYAGSPTDILLYTVESFGPTGSQAAAPVAGTPTTDACSDESADPQLLASPSDLQWSLTHFGEISLSWSDRAATETFYRVLESLDGGTFHTLVDLPANSTSLAVDGLEMGRVYRYQVEAHDATRVSDRTGIATVEMADDLFADSFEIPSGSDWSSRVEPSAGEMKWSSRPRLGGSFALAIPVDDQGPRYLVDDSPAREPRYQARFRLDLADARWPQDTGLILFEGFDQQETNALFEVYLRRYGDVPSPTGYSLLARAFKGADGITAETWINTNSLPVLSEVIDIEFEWWASTAPGLEDGGLRIWIDSHLVAERTGIESDQLRLDEVRLGGQPLFTATDAGMVYVDEFASRRSSPLGRHKMAGEILEDPFDLLDPLRWTSVTTGSSSIPSIVTIGSGLEPESYLTTSFTAGDKGYVEAFLEAPERHLLVRLEFRHGALQVSNGESFKLLAARSAEDDQRLFELQLGRSASGDMEFVAIGRRHAGGAVESAPLSFVNVTSFTTLELEWWAASAPGADDGRVILRNLTTGDSTEITGLDNDNRTVRTLRLGASAGVGSTTSGTLHFDNIQLWR